MSEEGNSIFTTNEILHSAQIDVTGAWLGTIAYLKEHQHSPDAWAVWLGQQYAPGWEWFKGHGVNEIARMTALNLVAKGATLRSLSGDETKAELVVEGWPSPEMLEFFHLAQSDGDLVFVAMEQITTFLGLKFAWQREGNAVKAAFSR